MLQAYAQQQVAPNFLTKPALQEWLIEDSVDLKALTTAQVMASNGDQVGIHDRIVQNHSDFTGKEKTNTPTSGMSVPVVAGVGFEPTTFGL